MARLIDIEAINWYDDLFMKGENHSGVWVRYRDVEKLIRNAPIVDAVPVVRCRDCKHWSRMCDESYLGEPGLGKCRNERFFAFEYGFETEDNFTCADGERKGGAEDAADN